jgi:arsenic resistance protein ArsH
MSAVTKAQIDWVPLSVGAVMPTQSRTGAVAQVSGNSQSFNAVNQMCVLGRWMRMVAIPNRSSVAKTFQEFEEAGRMKPSSYYNRVVDLMEDLVKFTFLTRDVSNYLTDLYSERKGQSDTSNLKLLNRSDRTSSLSKVP